MLACVELMVSPDSERNAGFTPLHQPLLALSASKQKPRSGQGPGCLGHRPKSLTPGSTETTACGPRELLSTRLATMVGARMRRSAYRMVAAISSP